MASLRPIYYRHPVWEHTHIYTWPLSGRYTIVIPFEGTHIYIHGLSQADTLSSSRLRAHTYIYMASFRPIFYRHPVWGHVRFHISNQPTSDEPTKSLGIKTDYTPRAVVWLVNIFNCLAYGLWSLTPLSTLFQLCRGGQFYWWRKQEYPRKPLTNFIT